MPFKASAQFDVQFSQAQDWFKKRLPALRDSSFAALGATAHAQAFTLAGVTQLSLVNDVWKDLEHALANGVDFKEFQKNVTGKLEAAWGGPKPGRVETIWRTNIQGAYSAGRYAQITSPVVLAARPIWVYDTVLDSRTTQTICKPLSGVMLEATNPWWDGHIPPLHHRCRSSIRTLRRTPDQQLTDLDKLEPVQVPSTFGHKPTTPVGKPYKPDLVKYVPELQPRVKQVLEATPTSPLGTPVSNAINTAAASKPIQTSAQKAFEAINSVHGDGKLPTIPMLTGTDNPRVLGSYARTLDFTPINIRIKSTGSSKEATIIHEVGHFLDHAGIGKPGRYESELKGESKILGDWWAAIKSSDAFKTITRNYVETLDSHYEYLLRPRELFARSYTQFIATRMSEAGNDLLMTQLEPRIAKTVADLPEQWTAEDFAPIRTAFEEFLIVLEWVK